MRLTRDQVLDELQYLATVEHALVVHHLQIYYAFGTDEELGAPGGAPSEQAAEVAKASLSIAVTDMRHFGSLMGLLGRAGRRPSVERPLHVLPMSGLAIPIGSLTPAHFEAFVDRQEAIASAVDGRYTRLESDLASSKPHLGGDLASEISFILQTHVDHLAQVPRLVDGLAGEEPSKLLRARRWEPADDLERSLLAVSNQYYQALVAILQTRFSHQELGGDLFGRSQTAMTELDGCNKLLVARGLIPRLLLA